MKAAELHGALLDYWVARAEHLEKPEVAHIVTASGEQREWCQYIHHYYAPDDDGWWTDYRPSTDWSQGGPIIERECIELSKQGEVWHARKLHPPEIKSDGSTMLEAAMRAYVTSRFGAAVPDAEPAELSGMEEQQRVLNRLRL
ncbi:phage protein NinX family protein [Noviherbaspirillum massiliense]|uniref:phage protein NinX family protein n=1 Tax=Noviherbaspirillum massiliense TaxID=1465823 RepID=UPI0002E8EC12|nr:phage protein NinX family protein [Noviherbaspirillum massiliense]